MFRAIKSLLTLPEPTELYVGDSRYVPLRPRDLVELLRERARAASFDEDALAEALVALRAVLDQEADAFERQLVETYADFNPDRDTLEIAAATDDEEAERQRAEFVERIRYLFEKANFERLDDVQISEVIRAAQVHGLPVRVDPDRVKFLDLWVRGHGAVERTKRTWRAPIKGETYELPVYRRMAVVAQLVDEPHIRLKLFKDIPECDVEALLPHAEVAMNWLDHVKVFFGGAGALGSTFARVLALLTAGVLVVTKLLQILVIGLGTLIFKTFMGMQRAKKNRVSQRTQNLYYQNLSNNTTTIHSMISFVADEEFKEAALAYAFCLCDRAATGDEAELDAAIEGWLREEFDVRVDFDSPDALETLRRLGLFRDQADGPLRVISPEQAADSLRAHWAARRSTEYHAHQADSMANAHAALEGAEHAAGGTRAVAERLDIPAAG